MRSFIFEQYFENYQPVSTGEIVEGTGASRPTVSSQTENLENEGILESKEHGNKKFYAPSDEINGNFLKERELSEIKAGISSARDILGGIREPKLREVAFIIDRNPESEVFRKKFYEAAKDLTWTEPKESKKSKLLDLIKTAIAVDRDHKRSPSYPEKDNWKKEAKVKEYIADNKDLLSEIELNQLEMENLRYAAHVPHKLKIFLGEDSFYYSEA